MKQLKPCLALAASIAVLSACGGDGPDASDVKHALTQNVADKFDGCEYFEYSDVSVSSQSPLPQRPNVHQAIVSYDLKSMLHGEEFDLSSPEPPDDVSDACSRLFAQTGSKVDQKLESIVGEFRALQTDSPQDIQKLFLGKTNMHATDRTVNLQKGENGWRLIQ